MMSEKEAQLLDFNPSDEDALSKSILYLLKNKRSNPPKNPIEKSLYMNENESIFVYLDGKWQEIEEMKNTKDYPGFE
jgi:hypothetical protein